MIIDDDLTFLEEISSILLDAGYEVATCGKAVEAIHVIRMNNPQCILLDINMPGMKGDVLLPWINSQKFNSEVVICSGAVFNEEEVGAMEPAGILKKPFKMNDLIDMIDSAIMLASQKSSHRKSA